jgi:hypothetical protein
MHMAYFDDPHSLITGKGEFSILPFHASLCSIVTFVLPRLLGFHSVRHHTLYGICTPMRLPRFCLTAA